MLPYDIEKITEQLMQASVNKMANGKTGIGVFIIQLEGAYLRCNAFANIL